MKIMFDSAAQFSGVSVEYHQRSLKFLNLKTMAGVLVRSAKSHPVPMTHNVLITRKIGIDVFKIIISLLGKIFRSKDMADGIKSTFNFLLPTGEPLKVRINHCQRG